MIAITVGSVVRAAWVLILHPPFEHVYSDMQGYFDRAVDTANGGGVDRYDAFYPPLTHLLLSAPMRIFGTGRPGLWAAAALWFVLSCSVPVLLWRYTRHWLGPRPAAIAAAAAALWPLHITYSGYFLSEIPATALLLGTLCCVEGARRSRSTTGISWAVGAGVLAGMAVATRPQMLLNVVVGTAAAAIVAKRRITWLAPIAAGFLVTTAVVVAHNTAAAGKLSLLSENGGMTFYLGHCDVNNLRTERNGVVFEFGAPPAAQRGTGKRVVMTDRLAWDSGYFYKEGLKCVADNGIGHLRLIGRSLGDMTVTTMPWPQVNEGRVGAAVNVLNDLFMLALLPVIVWAFRRGGPGERVMLLHLGCAVPLAVIVFGDPRFRTPYDVFGLALAAAFISFLYARTRLSASGESMSATERYEPGSP